ncbi:formyltetrahydrofolate deformylase [Alphaproteobacteria bacterium]|nr:formyltetrahydrofolate deformylase [Alphaproteobacteria bacterium]
MDQDRIYLLRLNCKDQVGIVSKISTLLANKNCNIIESKQFTDQDTNNFFIRQTFQMPIGLNIETINEEFKNLSNILNCNYEIRHVNKTLKTLILVSKFDHCLIELINKTKNKNLNLSIEAVISNHNDLKKISSVERLPFYHFPINNDKLNQEKHIIEYIEEKKIEIIILARYMQILSENFVNQFYGKIINIHHSFLPSFKGAKPYHQAFERGVKIIGATAHFVSQNLDEGPIIEQDVEKVDHELSPSDLVAIGKDIEARVLYKAIKNFSEGRVFLNGEKTVVFKGDKIL